MAISITLILLTTTGPREAASQPQDGASLSTRYTIARWQGHRRCPGQDYFRQALEQALGPEVGSISQGPMQLSIHIQRRGGNFQLELETKDDAGAGSRKIDAPNCKELLTTAAVIVSLAMQPELLFENESEREVFTRNTFRGQAIDGETPGKIYREERQSTLLGPRDYDTGTDLKVAVGLAGVADVGTLPRAAIGLGIVASVSTQRHVLSFRLTQWAEQRRYLQSASEDRGGNFDYISANLDFCRDLLTGRVSSGLCVLLGMGRLNGESIVIDMPISQSHIMANAGSAAFARLATSKESALRIQVELVVNFLRPRYTVELLDDDDDTLPPTVRQIHHVAPLSTRLAASWGLRF